MAYRNAYQDWFYGHPQLSFGSLQPRYVLNPAHIQSHFEMKHIQRLTAFLEFDHSFLAPWTGGCYGSTGRMVLEPGSFFSGGSVNNVIFRRRGHVEKEEEKIKLDVGKFTEEECTVKTEVLSDDGFVIVDKEEGKEFELRQLIESEAIITHMDYVFVEEPMWR